ncbi:MAG: rod shape-determining protein [Bacilli bacterium]
MKRELIGIDFGSQNTRIYSDSSKQIIFNEPSCMAIDTYTHKIIETGFLASKIQGKAPYNYQIVYPIENGMISDIELASEYLSRVISKLNIGRGLRGMGVIFGAPSKCTKVNRNSIVEICKSLQAKEIYIESQVKLAALGTGEDVYSPNATLVCDIGAQITDIACLSMGEVVNCDSTFIASVSFDEAIRRYLIQEKHLSVGKKTAEYVKMRIGTLSPLLDSQLVEVKGRDTITSLPSSTIVSGSEIRLILTPLAQFLVLKITDVISSLPPDLASDLVKNGLILTGGGSLLSGIKNYFQTKLNIPVFVTTDPSDCVIRGIGNYCDNINSQKEGK